MPVDPSVIRMDRWRPSASDNAAGRWRSPWRRPRGRCLGGSDTPRPVAAVAGYPLSSGLSMLTCSGSVVGRSGRPAGVLGQTFSLRGAHGVVRRGSADPARPHLGRGGAGRHASFPGGDRDHRKNPSWGAWKAPATGFRRATPRPSPPWLPQWLVAFRRAGTRGLVMAPATVLVPERS
jgi:hypothetical protein